MPEQELDINQEVEDSAQSFVEKLKNAENAENAKKEQGSGKNKLENLIERNREMVHKSEVAIEQAQEKIGNTPSPAKTTQQSDNQKTKEDEEKHVKFHAKDVTSLQNPDDQIAKIVEIASKKNPYFAIKVAQHINNNYILDKVHDNLTVDQAREALIKKGLLEDIK